MAELAPCVGAYDDPTDDEDGDVDDVDIENSVTATLMVAVEVVMTDVIVSGVVLARHATWQPHMSFCVECCHISRISFLSVSSDFVTKPVL